MDKTNYEKLLNLWEYINNLSMDNNVRKSVILSYEILKVENNGNNTISYCGDNRAEVMALLCRYLFDGSRHQTGINFPVYAYIIPLKQLIFFDHDRVYHLLKQFDEDYFYMMQEKYTS